MTHQLKGWKSAQVGKAVTSLLKYIGKQQEGSADLLEDEEIIYVQIALKKSPTGPKKDKPVSIPLPHPLYTADGVEVCVISNPLPKIAAYQLYVNVQRIAEHITWVQTFISFPNQL